jgi:rod shape-determining protein MreD
VVRGLLVIVLALAAEALLGRLIPSVLGFVDVMLIPVAWYGISRSQRSAMLVGCGGGLLQDAWFQAGTFGVSGFTKTLLGWALGGLAVRLDLDHVPGRLAVGAGLSVADHLLEIGLNRLLDLNAAPVGLVRILVRGALTGLLVAASFPIVERMGAGLGRGKRRRRRI